MKKQILVITGTRPNFIKVTQFKKVAENYPNLEVKILHTGQHFDKQMAEVFFSQFGMQPDYFLNINPGSALQQMAEIIMGLDNHFKEYGKPDLMLVPGDVNSTQAAALVANKLDIKLGHIESGLRSDDRKMPEEINRIVTDELSDYFFVTEPSGLENLKAEARKGEILYVGNTMIDTLVAFKSQIDENKILNTLSVEPNAYYLVTLHRPSNVDTKEGLSKILEILEKLTAKCKVVFPVHPRTQKNIEQLGLKEAFDQLKNIIFIGPQGYFEFQALVGGAKAVITDSGGIQEETTFRQIPCLTLRENTERPVTITEGTNTLVGTNQEKLFELIDDIEQGKYKKGVVPKFWDGKATERIFESLNKILK
jgi:UDP-N-acetylglucosamine 2-epimerase (non-hydrolysing)